MNYHFSFQLNFLQNQNFKKNLFKYFKPQNLYPHFAYIFFLLLLLVISWLLQLMSHIIFFLNQVNFSMIQLLFSIFLHDYFVGIIRQIFLYCFNGNNCTLLHLSSFLSTYLSNIFSILEEQKVHLFLFKYPLFDFYIFIHQICEIIKRFTYHDHLKVSILCLQYLKIFDLINFNSNTPPSFNFKKSQTL